MNNRAILLPLLTIMIAVTGACSTKSIGRKPDASLSALRDSLQAIADRSGGEVGIALLTDSGDTLVVNNEPIYPLMSVFKLHQAIALCEKFERTGRSLDSIVSIPRRELNPDTWSPMLKYNPDSVITLSIRQLLCYTLTLSDNNASNYMFEKIQSVAAVDSFIAGIIPRNSFELRYTEADMWSNHSLCYANRTSPLGAAILIDRLFTDSIISEEDAQFIRTTLQECETGTDRLVAPLADVDGVAVAHKTGSGFRTPEGILSAHNDVGVILLPGNRHYTLAVFVKDYPDSETEAAKVIASVSAAVYSVLR